MGKYLLIAAYLAGVASGVAGNDLLRGGWRHFNDWIWAGKVDRSDERTIEGARRELEQGMAVDRSLDLEAADPELPPYVNCLLDSALSGRPAHCVPDPVPECGQGLPGGADAASEGEGTSD